MKYLLFQTGLDKTVSLLYYFATDGVTDIKPVFRGSDHLTALHGSDGELGEFTMKFNAIGEKLTHNHLISYTPGYHNIDQVLKYGLNIKHSSEAGSFSSASDTCDYFRY